MRNYIEDENKYKLAGPPKWFLLHLWDFDNSLVIIPSRQGFFYRLAQRRKPNLTDEMCKDALFHVSDTQMLARYGLIPVTTILATANWSNPYIFEELRRRAPWRLGGVDEVCNKIEEAESATEKEKLAKTELALDVLSKDAWGMYNKKIGLRSQMWSPKTKRAVRSHRTPTLPDV